MSALRLLILPLAIWTCTGPLGAQDLGSLAVAASGATSTLLIAPVQKGSLGLTVGRLDGGLGITKADGFNLSVVGRYPVADAWSLEGRLGANYGRADATAAGPQAFGDGLAYGAGLRWNFSPRASATVGWDSQSLGFAGNGRETVRAARLGLQWRY